MIEVKWDFEGPDQGRAAQATVDRVIRRVQRGLGAIVCPTHGRGPALRVGGQIPSTIDIGFETCCQDLMEQTCARIRDIRHSHPKAESGNSSFSYEFDRRQVN